MSIREILGEKQVADIPIIAHCAGETAADQNFRTRRTKEIVDLTCASFGTDTRVKNRDRSIVDLAVDGSDFFSVASLFFLKQRHEARTFRRQCKRDRNHGLAFSTIRNWTIVFPFNPGSMRDSADTLPNCAIFMRSRCVCFSGTWAKTRIPFASASPFVAEPPSFFAAATISLAVALPRLGGTVNFISPVSKVGVGSAAAAAFSIDSVSCRRTAASRGP